MGGDLDIGILHAMEPQQQGVIWREGEWMALEVIRKRIDRPPDGQELLLHVPLPTVLASRSDSFLLMYRWVINLPHPYLLG